MARDERLRRMRAELWLLEEAPEGLSAHELASQLDVSTRTAQRDLQALRAAGYPLSAVGARWRFVEGQALPTTLSADGANHGPENDRIMAVDRAIRQRRPIRVAYFSHGPGGPVHLSLAPLLLKYIDGSLFLVAREHPRGRIRAFAVERLANIRPEGKRFPKDVAHGLDEYLRDKLRSHAARDLVRVTIRIEAPLLWRVTERIWHPSQRVTLEDDGSALVSFRVPGFTWVKAWALGFGSEALVLEPPALIQTLREELETTLTKYRELAARLPQLDLFDS